jgi:hypothetical protein
MNLGDWRPPHADLDDSAAFYCVISEQSGPVSFLAVHSHSKGGLIAFLRDWIEARRRRIANNVPESLDEPVAFMYLVIRLSGAMTTPPSDRLGVVVSPSGQDPTNDDRVEWIVSEFGRGTADIAPVDSTEVPLRELLQFASLVLT